ncbi:MAG: helix-turn-helix domain-containing protein, partial [Alphaproteobacteria bacterium]|nr:helix-turn-helix domain-containing protein [Alphaproteobacteria bacterium]MDX5370165.1 helix-turn-helix domain-containing protein [Alphaproteobacteria bacterium]MDX5464722.1 helix-turn-helix domain-containing protein [Alphaproteobacteria bacterium]
AFVSAFTHLPDATPKDAPVLSAGITGLLRGILSGALDSEEDKAMRRSRSASMRNFLECNLQVADLGLDTLRKTFGASRSTVYRDFAPHGGLQSFIMLRRLERAYKDLANSVPTRGVVTAVAEKWCFNSVSHFSSLFRLRFGVSPSEVTGLWQYRPGALDPGGESANRNQPSSTIAYKQVYDRLMASPASGAAAAE